MEGTLFEWDPKKDSANLRKHGVTRVTETPDRGPYYKRRTHSADPEYDFSGGIRGKYVERYRKGTNVVLLDPEVAAAFPDSSSVNDALRSLLAIAKRTEQRKRP